ncbi:MAG TPA: TolC family protein, partial [Bacteroidia bacterium]|nr:TolC family protein [Bacteroidia bacterium]
DTASYSYSLQQCVDFAKQHNVSVQNAVLDQQAASYKVKETTGAYLPQINSTASVQHFEEFPTTVVPTGGSGPFGGGPPGHYFTFSLGTSENASLGFSGSQLLFNGSLVVALKATKTYEELAQKNVDRTSIETSAEVTKAYYSVLVNDEKKKLLDANLDRVKKLVDDTKALYANGFVEKIDVDRITVTYTNLQTEAVNVNRLLDLSIVLLKYQMGMDQSAKLTLTDKIENLNFVPESPLTGKFDYSKRIEYQISNLNLTGQKLLMRSERMGYFPTVALFGTLSTNAYRSKMDYFKHTTPWYPIALVGLQVNIPIFDGLQRHYRVQQDRVGVLKAQNTLVFMQQTIDMQQAVARVNLQNSVASLQSQKDNMTLAESVFDDAKKKYDQGMGSNLEVINAQTSLKEAQTNYFNALYDAVIAKVEYDKSIGTLTK